MKSAVVISRKKNVYGAMADAIIKASRVCDFNIKVRQSLITGYDNVILFDNRISRVKKPIRISEKTKLAWWMNDLRSVEDLRTKESLDHISYIFLCNTEYIDDYKDRFKSDVFFMPQHGHQFDLDVGRKVEGNIIFIGNMSNEQYHGNRQPILERLKRLKVTHISSERNSLDMGYLYKHTPISLSISNPVKEYNSNRLYNIIASQGFALVAYCPGLEKQFVNHEHIVWFHSLDEAYELAKYYINHKRYRNKIAKKGYELFTKKHMAQHRIQNMIDIMNGDTKEFYGYL